MGKKDTQPVVLLYIDGKIDGQRHATLSDDNEADAVKIAFCNADHPSPSFFAGRMKSMMYQPSALSKDEVMKQCV